MPRVEAGAGAARRRAARRLAGRAPHARAARRAARRAGGARAARRRRCTKASARCARCRSSTHRTPSCSASIARPAAAARRSSARGGRGAPTPGVMEVLAAISIAAVLSLSPGIESPSPRRSSRSSRRSCSPTSLRRISAASAASGCRPPRRSSGSTRCSRVPAVVDAPRRRALAPLRTAVRVEDLRFDGPTAPALAGVTLEVPAGQTPRWSGEAAAARARCSRCC